MRWLKYDLYHEKRAIMELWTMLTTKAYLRSLIRAFILHIVEYTDGERRSLSDLTDAQADISRVVTVRI